MIKTKITTMRFVLISVGFYSSKLIIALCLVMTFGSLIFSAYLLYILVYVINKICLVCMSVHIVNLLTFILFTIKWRTVGEGVPHEDKKKTN